MINMLLSKGPAIIDEGRMKVGVGVCEA